MKDPLCSSSANLQNIIYNLSGYLKTKSFSRILRCFCVQLQVPNLVFLAVSPEEKESWVNALNMAITKAKNRVFDEVGLYLFILRLY